MINVPLLIKLPTFTLFVLEMKCNYIFAVILKVLLLAVQLSDYKLSMKVAEVSEYLLEIV